jgi:hypothetical protein
MLTSWNIVQSHIVFTSFYSVAQWGKFGVSPSPPESLESESSHEIPRKIRRAKKLDIKIRETKDLAADGFSETAATCAIIARLISSVKVARHMRGCGKVSVVAGGLLGGGIASRPRALMKASQERGNASVSRHDLESGRFYITFTEV